MSSITETSTSALGKQGEKLFGCETGQCAVGAQCAAKKAERSRLERGLSGLRYCRLYFDCLRRDDLAVDNLLAGWPCFVALFLAFDDSAWTAAAIFAESTLHRTDVRERFDVFSSDCFRLEPGQYSSETRAQTTRRRLRSAALHRNRRNLLVIHDLCSP